MSKIVLPKVACLNSRPTHTYTIHAHTSLFAHQRRHGRNVDCTGKAALPQPTDISRRAILLRTASSIKGQIWAEAIRAAVVRRLIHIARSALLGVRDTATKGRRGLNATHEFQVVLHSLRV